MATAAKRLDRIYIVPTVHGVAFLLLIVVMILVAAASGNNLVYGLAFTLFAVYMMSMISTNTNLKSLSYELSESDGVHVDEVGLVQLVLINPNRKSRFLLHLKARKQSTGAATEVQELGPQQRMHVQVPISFNRRGVYDFPSLQISTFYPLGLFTAWTNFKVPGHFFVYPKREGQQSLSALSRGIGGSGTSGASGGVQNEDFREHSRYLPGESQHQVDWKVFARHTEMLSKRYDKNVPQHYVLAWSQVSHLPHELALSQLAQWVAELQHSESSFELRLPQNEIGKGRGMSHGQTCLRLLAQFPRASA